MPKKPLFLLLFICAAFSGILHAQQFLTDKVDISTTGATDQQNAAIYLPANYDSNKSYPLILSMHGMGQAGSNVSDLYNDGLPYVLKSGYKPAFDFIMIAPQRGSYSVDPNWLPGILADVRKRFSIDDSRIYLTGYDAGGWPVYGSQLNISSALASQFAAIVVCSGATQDGNINNLDWWKTTQTPLWAIVGDADASYRDQNSNMVTEINKRADGAASLTIRSGMAHGGWNDVYKGTVKNGSLDIWQWLYQFQRVNGAVVRSSNITFTGNRANNIAVRSGAANNATKSVPGRIEAEDYNNMNGIQTEATQDNGGGQNVGWIDNNDWMDYNINVASSGSYTVNFRVATPNGGQFQIRQQDGTVLATVAVPKGSSYQIWQTISTTVNLSAGTQTLRIYANKGGWNLNWLEFTNDNSVTASTPPTSDNTSSSNTGSVSSGTGTQSSGVKASLYFDDGQNGNFTATCIRVGDVLSGLIDDNTGEAVTYTKTNSWIDGSAMTVDKIDGAIYRKKGNEYFRRNYAGAIQAQWFTPADGRTDNTQRLQKALDLLRAAQGGTLEFKDGTYIITPTQLRRYSLIVPSNVTVNLSSGATIKVAPNSVNYTVFYINQVNNVTINGGTIIGDKDTHPNTSTGGDDMGVGINVNSSSNIKILNTNFSNIWGDGIYVGRSWSSNGTVPACTNLVIDGVTIDGSWRDGITIAYADGVTISNSKITNSRGKAPEAGIIIEPNIEGEIDYVRNIKLSNLYLGNNAGVGIGSDAYKLTADNITAVNNGNFGIYLSTKIGTTESGDCVITNSYVAGNGTNGTSGGIGLKNTITVVSIKSTTVTNNIGYGIIVDNTGGPFIASDNKIMGNTQRGFYAVGTAYPCTFTNNEVNNNGSHISLNISNGTFSGNKVYRNGPPVNLREGAVTIYGDGWKISANSIYDNPTHGLYIEGSNNLIDGNTIYGNSQSQDGYYDNIKLLTGANNNILQNNNISKGSFQNAPGYGIRINLGANNNRVTGNIMNGNGGKIADITGDYIQ